MENQDNLPPSGKDPIEERYAAIIANFGELSSDERTILLNQLRTAEAGAMATGEAHGYAEGYEIGMVEGKALSILFAKLADKSAEVYKASMTALLKPYIVDGKIDFEAVLLLMDPVLKQTFLLGSSTMFMNRGGALTHIDQLTEYVVKYANEHK